MMNGDKGPPITGWWYLIESYFGLYFNKKRRFVFQEMEPLKIKFPSLLIWGTIHRCKWAMKPVASIMPFFAKCRSWDQAKSADSRLNGGRAQGQFLCGEKDNLVLVFHRMVFLENWTWLPCAKFVTLTIASSKRVVAVTCVMRELSLLLAFSQRRFKLTEVLIAKNTSTWGYLEFQSLFFLARKVHVASLFSCFRKFNLNWSDWFIFVLIRFEQIIMEVEEWPQVISVRYS